MPTFDLHCFVNLVEKRWFGVSCC